MGIPSGVLSSAEGRAVADSLDDLPLAAGLSLGRWTVWRTDAMYSGADDLFFLDAALSWVVRVYVPSAGWIDYRGLDGDWRTCYGDGNIQPESGHDAVVRLLAARTSGSIWQSGRWRGGSWHVTVGDGRLDFRHNDGRAAFTFHAERPLWTWNKKPLPGCGEGR